MTSASSSLNISRDWMRHNSFFEEQWYRKYLSIFVDSRLAENHGFLQILEAASSLVQWKIIEKVQLLYSSTCWHWQSFIRKMNG